MFLQKFVFCYVITITVFSQVPMSALASNQTCPIWKYPFNNTCKCGSDTDRTIICYPDHDYVSVRQYYCVSYSDIFNDSIVVGRCMYNLLGNFNDKIPYSHISNSIERGNNTALCHFIEYWRHHGDPVYYKNQSGLMCTSCEDGYAYPVYSYSMACVECKDYKYNWLKYIAVAFLPLTVFYIIVVLFRITVTSGAMNGYVLMCQLITAPVNMQLLYRQGMHTEMGIFFSFFEIWNLNFFRGLYPPFCLHHKLTTLQTLMFDYVIAVYPLVLVIITYIFVKLHNRYSIVVRLWSPFYKCFAKLRNNWDINGSLVGAFATFLLLSYVKILNVSFCVLKPNIFYNVYGIQMQKLFLYYDGTYEYFGKDHIPYALLAIFMVFIFNIFPLVLLCLYPCRCFQRCLNYCRLQSLTLNIFMDTFNGCYKIQPRDCRYFAGRYLFLRLLNLCFLALTTETVYAFIACFISTIIAVVVATIRPYKSVLHTLADTLFFTTLSCIGLCTLAILVVSNSEKINRVVELTIIGLMLILLIFSLLYGIGFFIYCLLPKKFLLKTASFLQQYINLITKQTDLDALETDEPQPYRLDHSDEYPPLLPVAADITNYTQPLTTVN